MATERLRSGPRGDARPADSFVQIISIVGARRRELRASVGARLRLLEARAAAAEAGHARLQARLAAVAGDLERLDRARAAESARSGPRRERIARLKQQLAILRGQPTQPKTGARLHTLGTALMYAGGLLVLWVVLLQLGLALGLS